MLGTVQERVVDDYDLVMFDLDGVVYADGRAIPGAAEGIRAIRDAETPVAFVTNNASRPPDAVAAQLTGFGVPAAPGDVVTSAQAAARVLAAELGPGARVQAVGGEGLVAALDAAGLVPVADFADIAAIATGYGPDVVWRDIMRAAALIRGGMRWVASNADGSILTADGLAPGHGAQVRMIADFAGVEPVVAGKPAPPLLLETIDRMRGSNPLMVGDRLDTDIEGAHAVGVDSALVLTGVTGLAELASAAPGHRPTYLALDLTDLSRPHPGVAAGIGEGPGDAECGGWRAHVADGRLDVAGRGAAGDWWRAAAVAAWAHLDTTGRPADVSGLTAPTTD